MKSVSNNPINISKGADGGFVEDAIINCVKEIILKLRMEFDVEYNDITYKELYKKCVQFAKEIDEILSAEILQQDNMFQSNPDFSSFTNNKLV